ncbi:MAG: hypothetical protein LC778_10160 [Acidobacteria bacterium]|nr:hypothetical protein [Acidobacteriota bacterium]
MKYKFKTKPYRHQVLALKKLLRNKYGGALLMDPRTGKTKVIVDWLSIFFLKDKIDRALIICPPTVLDLKVWQEEFALHCSIPYDIFVWDRSKRMVNGQFKGLPEPQHGRLLVVLVNYEAFSMPGKKLPSGRRSTKTGRIKVRNEVGRWAAQKKTAAVLDESHNIKTSSAATSRVIVTLRPHFHYRAILTGTVVTKASRAHDIYNQWRFLNPERFANWEKEDEFKNYFGVWRTSPTVPVPLFVRGQNLDELHDLMSVDAFSQERDKCFDLPPHDIQEIPITLNRARKIYNNMAKEMIAEFRQHTAEASIPLVKLLRLAQITGGFVTTDKGDIVKVGSEKIDILTPLLKEMMENQERIAIVARFKPELNLLYRIAQSFKVPVFQIRGGMNKKRRYIDFKTARQHNGPLIYILQPRAAIGIDLSFLSRMVWYSLTPSYVNYTQCCDRIALSRVSTTFTYLLCPGIDRLLYDTLQSDESFLKAVRRFPERLLDI